MNWIRLPATVGLFVLMLLGAGIWWGKKSLSSRSEGELMSVLVERAIIRDGSLGAGNLDQLLNALAKEEEGRSVRADVLRYAIALHSTELNPSQLAQFAAFQRRGGSKAENFSESMPRVLLNFSHMTTDSVAMHPSEVRQFGIDSGLFDEPLLLPMSQARWRRYLTTPVIPDRNSLFVSRATALITNMNDVFEDAKKLAQLDADVPAESKVLPSPPYPVAGQIRGMLENSLTLQSTNIASRGRRTDSMQIIAVGREAELTRQVIKYCAPSASLRPFEFDQGLRNRILQMLAKAGIRGARLQTAGCTADSLLISGSGTEGIRGNWMMVLHPALRSQFAGIVFINVAKTFSVEAVGTVKNPAIYLARQVGGSGGFLDAFVIDLSRRKIMASISAVPNGQLDYLLKSDYGPQYLFLRQSVVTSARTIRNAAPKKILTTVLRMDREHGHYRVLNIRLSRREHNMQRAGDLHPSQIPDVAAKIACRSFETSNPNCEMGAKSLLAEAEAHENMDDPQGAARLYEAFLRQYQASFALGDMQMRMQLLNIFLNYSVALLQSNQYHRLSGTCEMLSTASWLPALGAEVVAQSKSMCANLLGLAHRMQGNYAASVRQFEIASDEDPRDIAPFGNIIRNRIDVEQPRQALSLLLSRLFEPGKSTFYTEFQRLQFAQVVTLLNRPISGLVFLLPSGPLSEGHWGMTLAIGGASLTRNANDTSALALIDESVHYMTSHGLRDIGVDAMLNYARVAGRNGKKDEALFLIEPLIDPNVEVPAVIRAQAYEIISGFESVAGDKKLAFQFSERAVRALEQSLPDKTDHERYFSSLLGMNRSIIERWFELAQQEGVSPQTLYHRSLFWKSNPAFDHMDDVPIPKLGLHECALDFLKINLEIWRFDTCANNQTSMRRLAAGYPAIEAAIKQVESGRFSSAHTLKLSSMLLEGFPLHAVDRIFVTPDKGMGAIPWTALLDPVSHQFLAEFTRVILYFPGRSLITRPTSSSPSRLGIIASAGAAHDADGLLLPSLPQVADEVSAIMEVWPSPPIAVLTDLNLTVPSTSWRDVVARSNVLHVAAHGEINGLQPDLSTVVLADTLHGRITPRDFAEMNLGHVRLAVLNVCSSGYLRPGDAFGDVGFRTTLLGRGVAMVIDTGWKINDKRGAEFAQSFYRNVALGASVDEAFFRSLKVARAKDPDPLSWGVYSLAVRDMDGLH